jgi:ABC-type multidrug transport system ATPase subunit
MGASGAGKTTLLNALSDRLKIDRRNKLSGSRQINDCIPLTQESFGRYGAYVM